MLLVAGFKIHALSSRPLFAIEVQDISSQLAALHLLLVVTPPRRDGDEPAVH